MKERLRAMIREAEKLCDQRKQCEGCVGFGEGSECVDRLITEYLIENGVLVPPCKVGDKVYCIEHKTIRECVVKTVKSLTYENVTRFFVEAECEIESPFYSDGRKIKHGLSAVWETEWGPWFRAFRTIEEAKTALAEQNDGGERNVNGN